MRGSALHRKMDQKTLGASSHSKAPPCGGVEIDISSVNGFKFWISGWMGELLLGTTRKVGFFLKHLTPRADPETFQQNEVLALEVPRGHNRGIISRLAAPRNSTYDHTANMGLPAASIYNCAAYLATSRVPGRHCGRDWNGH